MRKILLASAAAALLAGCASVEDTFFNNADDALSPQEEHPISVNQQVVTLRIAMDPLASDISNIDKARLRAFVQSYFRRGHGPVTITAPSGSGNDLMGQEMAADIRAMLFAEGLDYADMMGATYRSSGSETYADLIVSYSEYQASGPECGDWSGEYLRRMQNKQSKNYGCATQANLAAMISDPRDLADSGPLGIADSEALVRSMKAGLSGEEASSTRDGTTEVSSQE